VREAILEKYTSDFTNDFEKLLEQSFATKFKVADLVEGVIVKIEKTGILVDIGGKTEAFLPYKELSNLPFQNPETIVCLGETKQFYVLKEEDEEGQVMISLRRVHLARNWENLDNARRNEETVNVRVLSLVKGGVIAEIFDLRGFIPASQLRTGIPHESLIDQELAVKVIEADPKKNKLILSERLALAEERKRIVKDVIASLNEEQIIEGEVVRLADFGAFIDVMGIDGLLPISEISWQRIKHPSDILKLGQLVQVKVLNVDINLSRVSLSLKRMEENPWVKIEDEFKEGQVVKGTVNKITNFGAFVNIFPGVEALLPATEMSEDAVNPYEFLSVGQEIQVLIKRFSPQERRIGLSIRDVEKSFINEIIKNESIPEPVLNVY
jgi:ribosomal protein S1